MKNKPEVVDSEGSEVDDDEPSSGVNWAASPFNSGFEVSVVGSEDSERKFSVKTICKIS